ncbi:MAG: FHA domain-containing protein [Sulfitobacter sp.]
MKLMRAFIGRKKKFEEPEYYEPEEIPEDAPAEFERLDAAYKQKVGGFEMPTARAPKPDLSPPDKEAMYKSNETVLNNISAQLEQEQTGEKAFNVWDLVGNLPEASIGHVAPGLFPAAAQVNDIKFPVGWLLVSEGPGRGGCFMLAAGSTSVGLGSDVSVHLGFGDESIPSGSHIQIDFDAETSMFLLRPNNQTVEILLNGDALTKDQPLNSHDNILIGETTLLFLPLCGDDFDWAEVPDAKTARTANV